MYVVSIRCLNYSGQESETQFTVYVSNTAVTLEKGLGHQTWYNLVDPKQGYNYTNVERFPLDNVREKVSIKGFVELEKISYLPRIRANVKKKKKKWPGIPMT